ncbi:MAG: hypothetical protein ACPLRA_03290, partial [Candidatus Saccharicenans sp.]
PARGSAAGGGYATAEDLLCFARALYECRLLSEPWTNWIFTGIEPEAITLSARVSQNSKDSNKHITYLESGENLLKNSIENKLEESKKLRSLESVNQSQFSKNSFSFSRSVSWRPEQENEDMVIISYIEPSYIEFNPDSEELFKGQAADFTASSAAREVIKQTSQKSSINRSHWNLEIAGGAPGINAVLEFEGQTGYTIIVLANYDPPTAGEVARMIRKYLKASKD